MPQLPTPPTSGDVWGRNLNNFLNVTLSDTGGLNNCDVVYLDDVNVVTTNLIVKAITDKYPLSLVDFIINRKTKSLFKISLNNNIFTITKINDIPNTFSAVNITTGNILKWVQNNDVAKSDWQCVNSLDDDTVIVESVFQNLGKVDFNLYTRVECQHYWSAQDKDSGGGLFIWNDTATNTVDGGNFFSSKIKATGRWVRQSSEEVNVLKYGALPSKTLTYSSNPLSSKFTNLADVEKWYGTDAETDDLSVEINYRAIQSTIKNNAEVYIPDGKYILNRSLKLFSSRRIWGAKTTELKFTSCSGFVSPNTRIYLHTFHISNLTIIGDYIKDTPFDAQKCGFNFSSLIPSGAYTATSPLVNTATVENVRIINFAGHGAMFLSEFFFTMRGITVDNTGGHGFYLQGGNTTILDTCYARIQGAGYASYRILGAATLLNCNGNDTPSAYWGWFGLNISDSTTPIQSPAIFRIKMIGCNVEGARKSILLHYTGHLSMDNCLMQPEITAADPYYIFDEAYKSKIHLNNCSLFGNGQSTATADALIKSTSNNPSGKYLVTGAEELDNYRVKNVKIDGTDYTIPYFDIPVMLTSGTTLTASYASGDNDPAIYINRIKTNKMFFGGDDVLRKPMISSGIQMPENSVYGNVGSIYAYINTSSSTSDLYFKASGGTSKTGWIKLNL